jgi:hypothetical protein
MKHARLLMLGCLGIAAIFIANAVRRAGGVDRANDSLLLLLNGVAAVFAAAVVLDTLWHAVKGQGQACRHCGHLRQMSSFRVYSKCPDCGR